MVIQLGDGTVELRLSPDKRTASLTVDSGEEFMATVDLSPAELHQLAYQALALANKIRQVPGRG